MQDCPSLEQLTRLLTSQKETSIGDRLHAHVEDCSRCQQRLKELRGADAMPAGELGAHADTDTATYDPPPSQAIGEDCGTVIGRYKLLQKLGEGGMGTVYEAEQEQPIRRRVALKLIKPGMDSKRVIARFELERQALALMSHPNIARVVDGGSTPSGRPFFVMELVPGVPISRYCNERKLTTRQRLELFVPVCEAVQHAHHKGIIHRDIKPSNILVTMSDGKPVPKVIDFGLVKATTEQLSEHTLFTEYGTVVGTLEYMSPEQAEMSPLGIDTRADIYSLGAVLYELLTGSPPFSGQRLRTAGLSEMVKILREEDPQKPSTRLSQSAEALTALAARRRCDPAALPKQLRGELDWIVMKSLDKDRTRRYETTSHLAQDIRHYLAGETVEACPPSRGYRLKKFVQRYRNLLVTTAAFVLLLIAAVVNSTFEAMRAEEAERQAVAAQARAEQAKAEAAEAHFRRLTEERRQVLEDGLGDAVEQLVAIASAFDTWPALSRGEFKTFVGRVLERHPEIQALEWIPRVNRAERAGVEAAAQSEGLPNFQFRELVDGANPRTAEVREEYFPVLYVEPLDPNRAALGLDLGASLPRRQAIHRARDTGQPVATAPIRLAQEKDTQMGLLLFLPVYKRMQTSGGAERQQALRGCALAVFRIGDLVDRVLGELRQGDIALTIYDNDVEQVIYQSPNKPPTVSSSGHKAVQHLEVAGRHWRLEFVALPKVLRATREPSSN